MKLILILKQERLIKRNIDAILLKGGIVMIFNENQRKEFERIARLLIEFINDNCHPHVVVVVDNMSAELSEGVCAFSTDDYLKD